MITGEPRSAQVIAAYKRHKLSISALCRIHRLLQEFERERALDRRLAGYGVAIIVAVLALAALDLPGLERVWLF